MKDFLEQYNLLLAMTVLTSAAILIKCICALIYQILSKETEQITTLKNKQLKAMVTKYEACYQLRIPIYDWKSYVKNSLQQYRFLGISLYTLENFSIFAALVIMGSAILGSSLGIYYKLPVSWISIHAGAHLLFLVILGISECLFQVRNKRNVLETRLFNHFANHAQGKFEQQYLHPEEQKAYQMEYFNEKTESNHNSAEPLEEHSESESFETPPEKEGNRWKPSHAISPDMQELIDSLLEEKQLEAQIQEKENQLSTAASSEKYRLIEEIIKDYL